MKDLQNLFEMFGVDIVVCDNVCMSLIVVYVHPSLATYAYAAFFEFLDFAVQYSGSMLIAGDFNIPELVE